MIKINKFMSNHMYRDSSYETDTDCRNCDGACCQGCEKVTRYEITIKRYDPEYECTSIERIFSSYNEEEVERIHNSLYSIQVNTKDIDTLKKLITKENKKNDYFSDFKSEGCTSTLYAYIEDDETIKNISEFPNLYNFNKVMC